MTETAALTALNIIEHVRHVMVSGGLVASEQ